MTLKILPIFKGYSVDIKLRQFRKINHNNIKFIDFSSDKGRQLLKELRKSGYSKPVKIIKKNKSP